MTTTEKPAALLVIAQTMAVWYTTGFVWTLQLMDYPMVAVLRGAGAESYMAAHNRMFWRVLAPGLAVAAVTILLLATVRPAGVPVWAPYAGLVLLVLIMVLSGAVATPDREHLAEAFAASTHAHLLRVSWVRTTAFTAWGALDGWLLWCLVRR
jgi:hypothetical protein